MWKMIKQEPVAFQWLVQTILTLGIAFGWKLDSVQMGAIVAVTAAVLSFLTRSVVTPVTNPKNNEGVPLIPDVQKKPLAA
jgi:hypothetical protein